MKDTQQLLLELTAFAEAAKETLVEIYGSAPHSFVVLIQEGTPEPEPARLKLHFLGASDTELAKRMLEQALASKLFPSLEAAVARSRH